MKDVAVEDLLGRKPIQVEMQQIYDQISGKTILVTGAAGFIGANLVLELLKNTEGTTVVGLDNLNDYYDPRLKDYRLTIAWLRSKRPRPSPKAAGYL